MRPRSVVQAERLYGAAIGLLVVLPFLGWRVHPDMPTRLFALDMGVTAFVSGLLLLVLMLATRRGSRGALWTLVGLTALNFAGFAVQVRRGDLSTGLFGALTVVQVVMTLVAVALLFRPDARAWFAAPPEDDEGASA